MTARTTDLLPSAGPHTGLPDATTVPSGALFSCTTHGKIYRSDGTAWSDWLILPASASAAARQVLRLVKTVTQAMPSGVSTPVNWDSASRNTAGSVLSWSASSNPSRITALVAGQYQVRARGLLQGGANAKYLAGHLTKNGANYDSDFRQMSTNVAWISTAVQEEVGLAVGDYVGFAMEQTSGASLNCGTTLDTQWIEVEYLGPLIG